MRVLILQNDIDVLVGRGVGVVGIVDFRPSRVAVGHVQRPANHKRLPGTAPRVIGCPALDDVQGQRVELADDDVPRVLIGGVHGPEPALVHHEVDVGVSSPGVMVGVAVACVVQTLRLTNGGGLEVKLDDHVTLELVKIDGAVVDHLTRPGPRVREPVRREVIRRHEVRQRLVLSYKAVVMVTVHVPHLNRSERVSD